DTSVQFTGQATDAGIEGLAPPVEPTSVITAGFASSGAQHWASASLLGDTLLLNALVSPESYHNGMFLRFKLDVDRASRTFLRVLPLAAVPLVRADDLDPVLGDLQSNALHEIIYTDGRFILMTTVTPDCPVNSIRVNGNFCIQTNRRTGI